MMDEIKLKPYTVANSFFHFLEDYFKEMLRGVSFHLPRLDAMAIK
jgi:hypothetical protein